MSKANLNANKRMSTIFAGSMLYLFPYNCKCMNDCLFISKLSDYFPKPYPNEQAARAANVGKESLKIIYYISTVINGMFEHQCHLLF